MNATNFRGVKAPLKLRVACPEGSFRHEAPVSEVCDGEKGESKPSAHMGMFIERTLPK